MPALGHILVAAVARESDGLAMWRSFVQSFRTHLETEGGRAPLVLFVVVLLIVFALNIKLAKRLVYGPRRRAGRQ